MHRGRVALTALAAALLVAAPFVGTAVASPATTSTAAAKRAPAGPAVAQRLAADRIVDVAVRFTVRNVNRSRVACNVDGRTYRVSGHLTAPESVLAGRIRAVTLYEHGIAAGEWYWRLDLPGYHHAEELARRGQASVTIDRLGYGASSRPDGLSLCVGGEADIAHQIVQQLRAGTYTLVDPAGRRPPTFQRVVLAGQSNGGQIVQIAAYSFGDVDGLVIMDWTDLGLTAQANARFFSALQTCLRGGSTGRDGDPPGYAYYDVGSAEFRSGNFHDTDPAVLDAATPHQNRHPCGDMVSQLGAVFVDLRNLPSLKIPVLLLYGENDARVEGGPAHRARFTGTTTELTTVPGAGHYMGLARNAHLVFDTEASWLDRHQL
jgi:pimeloyl-ACP methyl ester carboxylesterase